MSVNSAMKDVEMSELNRHASFMKAFITKLAIEAKDAVNEGDEDEVLEILDQIIDPDVKLDKLDKKDRLLFEMARHIRNVDGLHPSTWGVQGGRLLMELRTIDGENYDKLVLGKRPGTPTDD